MRLQHAFDKGMAEELWLAVCDEKNSERAMKLLEPMLKGSFAKIKDRVRIIGWRDLYNLYVRIKEHEDLLKKLAKRKFKIV